MAKDRIKTQKKEVTPEQSRIAALLRVGNYAQLRKEAPLEVVVGLEPNPLVFWIGIGSVAVAIALTACLMSLG